MAGSLESAVTVRGSTLECLWFATFAVGCGQVVVPSDAGDARPVDAVDDRIDESALDSALDDVVDARDSEQPEDAPCVEPTTRPARSLRSCSGPNGAPVEHCREVWSCGGPFTAGSPEAFAGAAFNVPRRQSVGCDVGTRRANAGYIDAYEVSVARFRTWVQAGYPRPPEDFAVWWDNLRVGQVLRVEPTFICADTTGGRCGPSDPTRCTYRSTAGPNDNLPVNCVDLHSMLAFCWWEGKHLPSEIQWEFIARNEGRTALPFSDTVMGPLDPCAFGDVAGCPRSGLLPKPIDAHPIGQTVRPSGVFSLWGGLTELVWNSARLLPVSCFSTIVQLERGSQRDTWGRRGRDFLDTSEWATRYDHAATWRGFESVPSWRRPEVGFRCARWVPEPFAPDM